MDLYLTEKCGFSIKLEYVKNIIPADTIRSKGIFCVNQDVFVVFGPTACMFFNVLTRKCIKEYNNENIYDCVLNKDKTKVAISSKGLLTVCNALTGEQEWQKKIQSSGFLPIAFHQDCSQILTYNRGQKILSIHSEKDVKSTWLRDTSLGSNDLFDHHPTKQEIAFAGTREGFWVLNYNDFIIRHVKHRLFYENIWVKGQCYNPYAKQCIALVGIDSQNTEICFAQNISDTEICFGQNNTYNYIVLGKKCISLLFHPGNKLVFLLSTDNSLECWNFREKEHIYTIKFAHQKPLGPSRFESSFKKRLAWSYNNKKLFIALKESCIILPVSLGIMYRSDVKEKGIEVVKVLTAYNNEDFVLIHDIIYKIVKNLMKLYISDFYIKHVES
jgi:hypothetical protein